LFKQKKRSGGERRAKASAILTEQKITTSTLRELLKGQERKGGVAPQGWACMCGLRRMVIITGGVEEGPNASKPRKKIDRFESQSSKLLVKG